MEISLENLHVILGLKGLNESFGSTSGYSLLIVMTYCTSGFNDACL